MSDSDRLEDAGDVALALEGESADSIDERVAELEDVVERLGEDLVAERERRKALKEENQELREQVEQHDEALKGTVERTIVNHLLERLVPDVDVDDYMADPMEQFATVEEFGRKLSQTVDAVESAPQNPKGDPMTDNWQAVVEHARTLQDNPNHKSKDGWVVLYAQDVADATGNSTRWGRKLIQELGEGHEGAKWRAAKENPEPGSRDRKKALYVNLDVWGETA